MGIVGLGTVIAPPPAPPPIRTQLDLSRRDLKSSTVASFERGEQPIMSKANSIAKDLKINAVFFIILAIVAAAVKDEVLFVGILGIAYISVVGSAIVEALIKDRDLWSDPESRRDS